MDAHSDALSDDLDELKALLGDEYQSLGQDGYQSLGEDGYQTPAEDKQQQVTYQHQNSCFGAHSTVRTSTRSVSPGAQQRDVLNTEHIWYITSR